MRTKPVGHHQTGSWDLAKVEAGRFELNEADFEVGAILEEACLEIAGQAAGKGIEVVADLDEAHPLLRGDRQIVRQSLLNLLSNAVKFSDHGKTVTVLAAHLGDGGWSMTVRDQGIGMTPEEVEKALRPFEQVQSVRTRNHEGTGLGLSLVREFMQLHDGSLTIRSEAGVGTDAILSFPRARVVGAAAPKAPATCGVAAPAAGRNDERPSTEAA